MHQNRISSQRLGELFAVGSILLWSLFPFLVHPELNPLPPLLTASLSTLLAIIPMFSTVALLGRWKDLQVREAWPPIFYATILVAVLFYALLFWAAKLTSPVNFALLGLMEIPFSYLLLSKIRSERVTLVQALGSILMVLGAVVLLFRQPVQVNLGDFLIVLACLLPPFGNYFAKRARLLVGSETILLLRSAIGGLILLPAALIIEGPPNPDALVIALPLIALAGLFPMGISKILWTEAVHRLPIPKAVSAAALAPAFTVVLSLLILKQHPTATQLLAFIPISLGVVLIVRPTSPEKGDDLDFER